MNGLVYIILINYKNYHDTNDCIASILASDYPDFHLVIVDNNSKNGSVEKIISFLGKSIENLPKETADDFVAYKINGNVSLLESKCNKGFAGGNNLGIQFAFKSCLCKYIWLLNSDTLIDPKALYYLVEKSRQTSYGKIGIIGSKLFENMEMNILQGVGASYNRWFACSHPLGYNQMDHGQFDNALKKIDYIIGASMFVTREFIEEVGYMNETYFLYFEELDWILRGKKLRWNFDFEPRSKIYHKQGGSTDSNSQIGLIPDLCQIRNRIIFTKLFYPYCIITVYASIFVSILKRIARGQTKRALLIFKIIINPNSSFFLNEKN